MLGILVQIDAQDAAGSALPLRLASHDMPELCHLGGEEWDPALTQLPDFALDFFGGAFAGQVTAPRTGFAAMTTGLSGLSPVPADRARFADARVRIWVGDFTSSASADLGPLTLRFDGRLTGEPEIDDTARVARFEAAVQDSWADEPLLGLFEGSGGIEGPQDLEGQPKPLALGNIRFARGVLIDNVDNVWMVSDGAVEGIGVAYDRLASLGASSGDHADLAALLAASIPNGSWATAKAQGLVRFGAPPDGRVSFDVAGSNAGTGGYVRTPGAMIRRIADLAGGTVNAASLTALDSARPYNLQLQIGEQTTAREVIARIADSVAAVAGVSLTGELFAQALGFGTASETLNADGTSALPVLSVEELAKAAPSWKLATEAELTFELHSADEAAFGYRWQGEYSATRVYRIDDVVSGEDGASWAYINTAPAAGEALPVWPTTSNSHWQNFSPPVDPAAIGLEPGATRNVARGTYDAGTTYVRGDEVIFSGSSYRLIVDSSTGNAPPDVARWALIANAGSGPAGADGLPGLTILLSNEAHVVATAQDGSGGTYTDAGGTMKLLRGDTVLSPTFSIAAKTPNTSWISIDSSTGVYTVSDPGVDLATATIRAAWAGVNYDRTYTLAKSKQGVTGPRLALVADNQAFTFNDGAADPGSQTITLTALLNNLSGTAAWSSTPSVPLGGTGNTRTLSVADFGANRQVTVEATLGGITDRITLVRTDRATGALAGEDAVDAGGPLLVGQLPGTRVDGDFGGNFIADPIFGEGWAYSNAAYSPGASGDNLYDRHRAVFLGEGVIWFIGSSFPALERGAVQPGETYYFSGWFFRAPSATGNIVARVELYDPAGTYLGVQDIPGVTTVGMATGAWVRQAGSWVCPANVAYVRPLVGNNTGGNSATIYFALPYFGRAQPGADVTATAQRTIEPQFPVIEIKQGEAGHTGTRTVTHVAKRGTATLTGGTWSLPSTNVTGATITINSGTGTVSLSSVAVSGAYTVRYTHTDGIATDLPVNVTYVPAVAAGVGSIASSITKPFASTSFVAISNDMQIQLPSGVTVANLLCGPITLEVPNALPAGNTNVEVKWQRETTPGTWADVGAAAAASPQPGVIDEGGFPSVLFGSVTCNRTATGLTAGSTQKFRLVARVSGGTTRTVTPFGTVSAGG